MFYGCKEQFYDSGIKVGANCVRPKIRTLPNGGHNIFLFLLFLGLIDQKKKIGICKKMSKVNIHFYYYCLDCQMLCFTSYPTLIFDVYLKYS